MIITKLVNVRTIGHTRTVQPILCQEFPGHKEFL